MRALAPWLGLLAAIGSCKTERQAQLVVVISSDMRVPSELDAFRLRILGPDAGQPPARDEVFGLGTGEGEIELPTDFGIAPRDGDVRRRVTVDVSAMHAGEELFTTRSITTFVPHRRLRLDVFLARGCVEHARLCQPDETCRREGCVPPEIDPDDLPVFDPSSPLRDAGALSDAAAPTDASSPGIDAGIDAGVDAAVPEPVVPSNVPENLVPMPGTLSDLRVTDATTWNTDTGQIDGPLGLVRTPGEGVVDGIGFGVVYQQGGPALGVFSVNTLEVAGNGSVRFAGTSGAVVLAAGAVTIGGRVSVAAQGSAGGPGGGAGGLADVVTSAVGAGGGGHGVDGVMAGDIYTTQDAGGGGGGFGAGGGTAGQAPPAAGGPGGAAYGDPTLAPIVGGSGGGSGAYDDDYPLSVVGGGGGGALQIFSSLAIDVLVGGVLAANGAGGAAGYDYDGATAGAGGGGGSGGAILLEAPSIQIAGAVVANGGGGGGGGAPGAAAAQNGADGRDDAQPAPGGEPAGVGGSRGGDGGAGSSPAGGNGTDGNESGGGGGAAGRIRLNTATGQAIVTGAVSPDASLGLVSR